MLHSHKIGPFLQCKFVWIKSQIFAETKYVKPVFLVLCNQDSPAYLLLAKKYDNFFAKHATYSTYLCFKYWSPWIWVFMLCWSFAWDHRFYDNLVLTCCGQLLGVLKNVSVTAAIWLLLLTFWFFCVTDTENIWQGS